MKLIELPQFTTFQHQKTRSCNICSFFPL